MPNVLLNGIGPFLRKFGSNDDVISTDDERFAN